MFPFASLSILALCTLGVLTTTLVTATAIVPPASGLHRDYARAHSLGDDYTFPERDGWMTLNVSDLAYKYADEPQTKLAPISRSSLGRRTSRKNKAGKAEAFLKNRDVLDGVDTDDLDDVVDNALDKVGNVMHAVGKAEPVVITWYTGHDLDNPSCWSRSVWTPTDHSFVAALTMKGWNTKPQCFKFLELCNGPKKCVFVRVVDTCAGCATGSKHVDLSRAAFGQLASFDLGILKVQMRPASDPRGTWRKDLWGPKV